jgi:hypothetical protein
MMPSKAKRTPWSGREGLVAAVGALIALLALGYAVTTMGTRVRGDWLTGVIEEKQFKPKETETQITFGKGGLSSKTVEGEYTFIVRGDSDGKVYTVWISKAEYDAKSPGDRFRFIRPKRSK